jgi:glycosyltransferase involved in cell wall biosynthesis
VVSARLLDLTRLLSRWGKGPMTGVDRVEFAYLDQLVSRETPAFGLLRSALGYLLIDRAGMIALRDGALDLRRDLIGRIAWRDDPQRGHAEAALRRLAIARCARFGLRHMLARHLPQGATYINTGHTNLDTRGLTQIKAAGLQIAVLVHDTIPLEHPEFARPDSIAPFRRKLQAVSAQADLVIHSTEATRTATESQFLTMGRVPPGIVANLGVTVAAPLPCPRPTAPYFVILGTIEPRKNHALLLDLWQSMTTPPHLLILGGRGWSIDALATRLDVLPASGPIQERAGLSDGQISFLLQGAQALLFPSFAEGFGIPALEAASLGTPVICSDLPVFRELLADFAVYLSPTDSYSWMETIQQYAMTGKKIKKSKAPPSWAEHFKIVLNRL